MDDTDGLYGDEAINTIVQEMENHRQDTVVIFAGYPDKMERFLQKNPGLRSRIAFHVPFEDYSPEELLGIFTLMAKGQKLELAPGWGSGCFQCSGRPPRGRTSATAGLPGTCWKSPDEAGFRLVRLDPALVTAEMVGTLLPEDIEEPPLPQRRAPGVGILRVRKMGRRSDILCPLFVFKSVGRFCPISLGKIKRKGGRQMEPCKGLFWWTGETSSACSFSAGKRQHAGGYRPVGGLEQPPPGLGEPAPAVTQGSPLTTTPGAGWSCGGVGPGCSSPRTCAGRMWCCKSRKPLGWGQMPVILKADGSRHYRCYLDE